MNKIDFTVGQAAGVAVSRVNADATLTTTGSGESVFAGLVIARRGAPGKVLRVTADNYRTVLGTPVHPRAGSAFEPYRHIERAVKGGNGFVVRVCAPDMKVPGLVISEKAPKSRAKGSVTGVTVNPDKTDVIVGAEINVVDNSATTQVSNVTFSPFETPTLPQGALAVIYIKDGDASENRALSLERESDDSLLYTLTLTETQADGTVDTLESHQVSFEPDALTDMNLPAWLPIMLDAQSTRLGVLVEQDEITNTTPDIFVDNVAFTGGTDGTLSDITVKEYQTALETLEASNASVTAILSLGCYDATVIAALNTLADSLRVDMFYDLSGNQTGDSAIQEATSHSLGGYHQACRYWYPFTCRDTFTGMTVHYGLSCDAFVAKAKGVASVPDVGGWFYSPAGTTRGIIDRQNIARLPGIPAHDPEAFVKARINTVNVDSNGDVYIDDALTTYGKNNYLRFQHVSSIMGAISRGFYEVAQAIKHEPDGVTQESLTKVMTQLLERFYAAGALVTPRDKTQGSEPFVLTVEQLDIDLWQVEWAVCPTGVARRIIGKPVLMR